MGDISPERWDWRLHIPSRPYEKVVQSIWDHPQLRSQQIAWDEMPSGEIVSTLYLHKDFRSTKTKREFGQETVLFFNWETMVYIPDPFEVLTHIKHSSAQDARDYHHMVVEQFAQGRRRGI